MSNPNPLTSASPAPRWFLILAFLALAGYGIFLGLNTTTAAGGSDSSGYANSARLLASGRFAGAVRVPEEFGPPSGILRIDLFAPWGFFTTKEGGMRPTYPPGLPLHLAAASKPLGWPAGTMVVTLGCALAAVCLCYLVGRELGLGPALAAAGAAALAACPVFIFAAVQPISDAPATTWALASFYFALMARRHGKWTVACGLAFAMAVIVRPTNSVLLPAVLVLIGLDWRRLGLLVLGGLPGAVWLGYYNYTLYGSPFLSGYSQVDISSAFRVAHMPAAFVDFVHWTAVLMPAVLLVLPLAVPFVREYRNRVLAALALWFGALVLLFASFDYSHETWSSLRYLLPALPAFILTALLGVEALGRRLSPALRPRLLNATAVLLILWAGGVSAYQTKHLAVLYAKVYEDVYADAALAAKRQLPPNALVLASCFSGSIYAYTDFPMMRCDQLDPGLFARFAAQAVKAGRPIYAVIFEVEEQEAMREHCLGEWTKIGAVKNAGIWRLVRPAPGPGAQ